MYDQTNFYYFSITVIVISIWLMWFYTKTPFGSLLVGIRDNANRVDYIGFRLPQTRAVNLIVSGTFAGIAGGIYALFQNLVSTVGVLDIHTSFYAIMMAYIGGIGNFFGPILGAAILGVGGDEAIHSILDIMYTKSPYTVIQRAMHIHPTVSELIPTVLGDLKPLE